MAQVLQVLPELKGDELHFVQELVMPMTDEQAAQFAASYRARRRDPTIILLTTLLVLIGFGGINRFLLGQIGMGILYLLTGGLCLIGSLIDLINYQSLTFAYNREQAMEIVQVLQG